MKAAIYIETSVISYLTADLSRDLIIAGHQKVTNEWWESRRSKFNLYISQLVIQEAGYGDKAAAKRRLEKLEDIPLLELKDEAVDLAHIFIKNGPIPSKSVEDALHIAVATVNGMDYLLSWNCKHIANAELRKGIMKITHQKGFECPIICTPEELMGR